MITRNGKVLAIAGALTLATTAIGMAQTASLSGIVHDPSGAAVPNAKVTLRNDATKVDTQVIANEAGSYLVPSLVPGRYAITIEATGFQMLRETGVDLAVGQAGRLDYTLPLGAVSQEVVVTSQAPVLDSESSTMGQVVGSKQITELPLLGRNPYALAILVPGVRASAGVNNLPIDQISTVSYAINGQRAAANLFLLDGAPNMAASQNQPVINANPDLVQEFKVSTSNVGAEYGNAAGGVFNVVTRSGTTGIHGDVYEFFRNRDLNANDYFSNHVGLARAPFNYNQFGGTVGGPVIIPHLHAGGGKNPTFFFFSTEFVRFVQGVTFVATVPTAQQLTGDFSNTRTSDGKLVAVYDPLTTTANTGGTGYTRTAFTGNMIPQSRLNPVALAIAKYFPAPNQAGAPITGVNNYVATNSNRVSKNTISYRVDQYFGQKNQFFARYSADDTPYIRAGSFGASNPAATSAGAQTFGRRNTVLSDTHTISPTWLATVRYSFTRLSNVRPPFSNGFDITSLGLPASIDSQAGVNAFPQVSVTGLSVSSSVSNILQGGILGATDFIKLGNSNHALEAVSTKVVGRHELNFGGEFRVTQLNTFQTGANNPGFTFTPAFTQGPSATQASNNGGLGLATFLLGIPGGSAQPAPSLAMTTKYVALFVQDNFRATSKLIFNLGFRWEYETPRTERHNQLTNFDFAAKPSLAVPGVTLQGGLSFVGVNGVSRSQANPDYKNFAPRIGIAYHATSKTVLRTGAGIFYSSIWGVGTGSASFGSSGFVATTPIISSLDGVTPIVSLSNPFPNQLTKPTGSSLGANTLLGQPINFYTRTNRTPYSGQWNASIQRELPFGALVEVGYTGSRGLRFPLSNGLQLNQIPDAALQQGTALTTQVANPYYGYITTGVLSSKTVSRAQLMRPFPQFDTVNSVFANIANSTYSALEIKGEKRSQNGLTILGAYTYSRNTDLDIGAFGGDNLSAGVIQDYNNLQAEYSPSALEQRQRLVVNGVYALPFYKTQAGVLGHLAGGWEVGSIVTLTSGGPLGITQSTNGTFNQGTSTQATQRPNWTGVSATLSNPSPTRWFDTTQFSLAAPYTYGNVPRTLGTLRSDGLKEWDATLNKTTVIYEQLRAQFRAEFFNLTNTPQFAPPSTTLGASTFGTVSAQNNQPRIIQFALKLLF